MQFFAGDFNYMKENIVASILMNWQNSYIFLSFTLSLIMNLLFNLDL